MTPSPARLAVLAALLLALAAPAAAQERGTLTLKERLGRKADDNQRVNDCKVPPSLRGDSQRPTTCTPPPGRPAPATRGRDTGTSGD